MSMSDTFEFDHLPAEELTDQHIPAATEHFQLLLRLYPTDDLTHAKQLHISYLQECAFSKDECYSIVLAAAKKAIAKQSI